MSTQLSLFKRHPRLAPVVGMAINEVWTRGDRRVWECLLAVAVFLFSMKLISFYGNSTLGRLISGSQTMGMFLLWIWLLRRVWMGQQNDAEGPTRDTRRG